MNQRIVLLLWIPAFAGMTNDCNLKSVVFNNTSQKSPFFVSFLWTIKEMKGRTVAISLYKEVCFFNEITTPFFRKSRYDTLFCHCEECNDVAISQRLICLRYYSVNFFRSFLVDAKKDT